MTQPRIDRMDLADVLVHISKIEDLAEAVVKWLESVGMHVKLSDANIDSEKFEQMTDDIIRMYGTLEGQKVPGPRPMDRSDILTIFNKSL